MKDRDHIQYKLERNVIYQQYLEKVLESAEEVRLQYTCKYLEFLNLNNIVQGRI